MSEPEHGEVGWDKRRKGARAVRYERPKMRKIEVDLNIMSR